MALHIETPLLNSRALSLLSERAIWLQQTVSGNSTQDIDEAVGSFVNALAFWSKAITST